MDTYNTTENPKLDNLYRILLESTGVTTDSRNVPQGSIFFALKGDNFNGNRFALAALEAGAAYAVIDESPTENPTEESPILNSANFTDRLIVTEDVLATLQQLAAHHRRKLGIPILALTGTNGKTTTKELITAVLSSDFNVAATSGNLNNHIGVPVTILGMGRDTEIGVVEMGASAPQEIATLAAIAAPDVVLITNVGKAHLLGFGSFDGVKKAKGELYDYIADNGGAILYNRDNPHLCQMLAEREFAEAIPYGMEYQGAELLALSQQEPFLRILLADDVLISTNLIGSYNADNVMAAIAAGEYFGITPGRSVKAISEYIPQNNRSQLIRKNGNIIIVDAYNANPTSMRAALENFAALELSCKNLILGDMLELGADSQAEHRAILEYIKTLGEIEECFFVGTEFRKSYDAADDGYDKIELKGAAFFESSSDLHDFLVKQKLSGKSFLVKGSRGTRLEAVLPAL